MDELKDKNGKPLTKNEVIRNLIIDRLNLYENNRSKTATSLGIARSTLYDYIKKYKIEIKKIMIKKGD